MTHWINREELFAMYVLWRNSIAFSPGPPVLSKTKSSDVVGGKGGCFHSSFGPGMVQAYLRPVQCRMDASQGSMTTDKP